MNRELHDRALRRARIIEGQMRGIYKMIDQEEYCMDILTQSLAVQKSISSLNKLIIENHIRTHIKEGLGSESEAENQKAIDELMKLYELSSVRGK